MGTRLALGMSCSISQYRVGFLLAIHTEIAGRAFQEPSTLSMLR